jgi:hypothetical protein
MKFAVEIEDDLGNIRRYPLDHEYNSENEAQSEAEKIADQIYCEYDIAWNIVPIN